MEVLSSPFADTNALCKRIPQTIQSCIDDYRSDRATG